jgi:hypothetical protein
MIIKKFPYFGKYKDFIDRSEYESNIFHKPFFIRSHPDNCFDFESQCLLLMMADRIFHNPGNVLLQYDLFSNNIYKNTILQSQSNTFWFIKLGTKDNIEDFENFYKSVKNKKVVFIIDNNESAEKFLERVSYEHSSIKDLPYIHTNDIQLRNAVIEKSIHLLLNYFSTLDNKISSIYIQHPELLIHPKNMMFLQDPNLMTSDMTDSYEILHSLLDGMKKYFNQLKPEEREAIEFGHPLCGKNLLKVAKEILSEEKNLKINQTSLILAIDDWLRRSWQYPYGIDLDDSEWKKFSFNVLHEMILEFKAFKTLITDESMNAIADSIYMISELLNNNAIQQIVYGSQENILPQEWEDLTYLRWPHLQYPMPLYLNELLEQSNKHLWIQHKNFNFVGYSKKLIFEHRKLNNMLEYYDKTLTLMKNTYNYFPKAMQPMFEFIIEGIEKRKELNKSSIDEVLAQPLQGFMDTFLEISLLFRSTYGSANRTKKDEISKIKESLKVKGNYGKDVAIIDGSFKRERPFTLKNLNYTDEKIIIEQLQTSLSHIIDKDYMTESSFLRELNDLLNRANPDTAVDVANAFLGSSLLENLEKGIIWKDLNFKQQVELIQNSSLVDHIREIFSQFEYFELHLNIVKNIDSLTLLQYFASIRNKVLVHKDATEDRKVDLEYLYESFIYSYESILIQYQYVLSQLKQRNLAVDELLTFEPTYIQLEKKGMIQYRKFDVDIKSKKNDTNLLKKIVSDLKENLLFNYILHLEHIEIKELTLLEVTQIKEKYEIEDEDVHVKGFFDINDYVIINDDQFAETDNKNIEILIKIESLK